MLTSELDFMFVVTCKEIATTLFVFSMDTKKVFKNKNGGREKVHRKNILHSFAFSRGNFKKDFVEFD